MPRKEIQALVDADLNSVRNEEKERLAWRRTAARAVKPSKFGRVDRAFVHPTGAALLRQKPLSRQGRWHDRICSWLLIDHGQVVARRSRYGRRHPEAPLRWATRQLRRVRAAGGQTKQSIRSSVAAQLRARVVAYTDLPARLVELRARPKGSDEEQAIGRVAEHDVRVPALIPTVPPLRTLYGEHSRHVLSQDEYDLYVHTWNEWVEATPGYAHRDRRHLLMMICIETVLQYRLNLLWGRLPIHRWSRLYHASYRRQQAAREDLGATRRQRLELCMHSDDTNLAVPLR